MVFNDACLPIGRNYEFVGYKIRWGLLFPNGFCFLENNSFLLRFLSNFRINLFIFLPKITRTPNNKRNLRLTKKSLDYF